MCRTAHGPCSRGTISLYFFFILSLFLPRVLIADEPIDTPWAVHARLVMEAYKECFPDAIGEIAWQDGDWTIEAGGRTFWWAEGRFLPADKRPDWAAYTPYINYDYPQEIPDPAAFSPEFIAEITEWGDPATRAALKERCLEFQEAIYGPLTRQAIQGRLERVALFGWATYMDRRAAGPLRRVEARVQELAKIDARIAAFLKSLGPVGGFNWREIKGTPVASYHSWGLAVDILPKRMGRLSTFWNWERVNNPDWAVLPLARRWHPPAEVVEAFEAEGFVWGGKWELWDTMHFEYRPELIWLRGLLAGSFVGPRGSGEDASLEAR